MPGVSTRGALRTKVGADFDTWENDNLIVESVGDKAAFLAEQNVFTVRQTMNLGLDVSGGGATGGITVAAAADAVSIAEAPPVLLAPATQIGTRHRLRAYSWDSALRTRDFTLRAKTTSQAGVGMFELLTKLDAAAEAAVFSVTSAGDAVFAGSVTATAFVGASSFGLSGAGAGIEIGSIAAPGTPFIDFHSQGVNTDYDVRLASTGGNNVTPGLGTLTVTAAQATFSGAIALATAVGKLVPGATSFSIRNNADSADNLLVADAGLVTFRAGLGIGVAPSTSYALNIAGTYVGASQYGIMLQPVGSSAATSEVNGVTAIPATAAAAFTCATVSGFRAVSPTKGATSTITSAYGLRVDAITAGVNNYGVFIGGASGGAGNNFSLYVAAGPSIFGGLVTINTGGLDITGGTVNFTGASVIANLPYYRIINSGDQGLTPGTWTDCAGTSQAVAAGIYLAFVIGCVRAPSVAGTSIVGLAFNTSNSGGSGLIGNVSTPQINVPLGTTGYASSTVWVVNLTASTYKLQAYSDASGMVCARALCVLVRIA